jgi:hypothetical protein
MDTKNEITRGDIQGRIGGGGDFDSSGMYGMCTY